ncbi:MAG: PAS domain S-box protein [Dehalococcoidia bacterium]
MTATDHLFVRLGEVEQAETELARWAEARRRNDAHYRALLQHTSDVIVVMGQTVCIQYVSPSVEHVLGYAAEELLGTIGLTLVHPEDRAEFEQFLARVCARSGVHEAFEFRMRHADGSWRHLEVIANNLLTDPVVQGIVQTIRDITESRLAKQQWDRFFELSLDLLCISGIDGYLKRLNPAWQETLGYSEAELLGKPYLDLVHPADIAATIAVVEKLTDGAKLIQFENRFRCKDGSYRWLAWTAAPYTAEGLIYAVGRDVTERHRAEEELHALATTLEQRVMERTAQLALLNDELDRQGVELREAKTFLETLIASGPVGMFRADPTNFASSYMSANSVAILGYTSEEVVGIPGWFMEYVHPNDRGQLRKNAVAQMMGQLGNSEEYRVLHKDGNYRWIHITARPEHDAAGKTVSILGYFMDISAEKEAQAGLLLAKEEAEQANRAKSEFLSRMSHELRTPLNAILGFAQLLEMDPLESQQRNGVQKILSAGDHLLVLINEVLDITRIEAGHLDLSPEAVSLRNVGEQCRPLVSSLAAARGVRLHLNERKLGSVHVRADAQRLKQVLLNLLTNAVKYNRAGGTVTLTCQDVGERLRITVHDTGYGISAEKFSRLFVPFDRLGAEQSTVEGYGLGLSLSKSLMESMGGRIGVTSVDGEGSSFWLDYTAGDEPAGSGRQQRAGCGWG